MYKILLLLLVVVLIGGCLGGTTAHRFETLGDNITNQHACWYLCEEDSWKSVQDYNVTCEGTLCLCKCKYGVV